MGKPTGFMEFDREVPGKLPVAERVKDYKEFVLDQQFGPKILEQAARCMSCGVPFCHSGCPLGNIIPEFNDAVYRKDWQSAYELLSLTNNFPEFTGRICPAPCEGSCVLGINAPPVTIENIEKNIIEHAFSEGWVQPQVIAKPTGKKVAVVGSGPSGLATAAQLSKAGHTVTVFERAEQAGGLTRYGIPDFKLEKSVVERRVNVLREQGVEFRLGVNVGVDITGKELREHYDAIVLAGGSTVPRDLPALGRELDGIHFAMDFLSQNNSRVAGKETLRDHRGVACKQELLATGKNVLVIGGGDTGSDCVGTSNRHRAKRVMQIEIMPKPTEGRAADNPWPHYPMVLKTTTSHEEGVQRQWCINTKAFVGDERGKLKAVRIVDVAWVQPAGGGRPNLQELPGTEREIPCELVLLAMGFLGPDKEGLLTQLGIELDQRGNVKAEYGDHATSVEGVFAAGDMRRGQSLVVWAISEGRECARAVDGWLRDGASVLEAKGATRFIDHTPA
jgi:glutamate synthase (NADPH/NADH) small chain